MVLIENINTLIPAADLKDIAEAAPLKLEKDAVARAINLAANTGSLTVTWSSTLSDSVISDLEELGYVVEPVADAVVTPDINETLCTISNETLWTISWE